MTEHITPMFLHCYLSQCLGLPVDLVDVTAPQLPPMWRQYYWVLELAQKNNVPVAITRIVQNSPVRTVHTDGTAVAKAENYCLVSLAHNRVYFDWRQDGDTMSEYAGYRGWEFSAERCGSCGYLWNDYRLLEEPDWHRRVTAVAQLCGICTRLEVAGVRLPSADVGWADNRNSRQCNSIRYRFYGHVEAPSFGLGAYFQSTVVFSLQICDNYTLKLDCSTMKGGVTNTITFATSDEFVATVTAQSKILSRKSLFT